jgi:hypothetical protein
MSQPALEDLLAEAAGQVELANQMLVEASPDALSRGEESLRRALSALEPARRDTGPAGADARRKASQFGAQVRRAEQLLESAAAFYFGWANILASMSGGYDIHGSPRAARPAVKHRWEG